MRVFFEIADQTGSGEAGVHGLRDADKAETRVLQGDSVLFVPAVQDAAGDFGWDAWDLFRSLDGIDFLGRVEIENVAMKAKRGRSSNSQRSRRRSTAVAQSAPMLLSVIRQRIRL